MTCAMRKCGIPGCPGTFVPEGRRAYCSLDCRKKAKANRDGRPAVVPKPCANPDCRKPIVWSGLGRVRRYCNRRCAMHGRRCYGLGFNESPEMASLGSEVPTLGMTPAQAAARKERIVLQLLRERVPTSAIEERFSESGVDVRVIAARNGMRLPRGDTTRLPYGAPVR